MITRDEGLAYADSPTNLMWRLQNDMTPVSRDRRRRSEETDDQPTFTEITLDVRPKSRRHRRRIAALTVDAVSATLQPGRSS